MQQNFEGPAPAGLPAGIYSTEQAHSWQQSLRMGSGAEFYDFTRGNWEALGRPRQMRVRLQAWITDPHFRAAHLVLGVQRPAGMPDGSAKPLVRQSFNLTNVVHHYQQWVPATYRFTLPADLQPTDEVVVYLWVPAGQEGLCYIDDFSLESLD